MNNQEIYRIFVGGMEFTHTELPPFQAHQLLMKMQKLVLPLIVGLFSGDKKDKLKSVLDSEINVTNLAKELSQFLDEKSTDEVILPLLTKMNVFHVESGKKVNNETVINIIFNHKNFFSFYELIAELLKFQFTPFFMELGNHFGSLAKPKDDNQQPVIPEN